MIIYHGNPNPSQIETARDAAPSYTHRVQYDIESFRLNTGLSYFLDNGAFNCYRKNKPWNATLFLKRLVQAREKTPSPDFVVLPDVVTDPRGTVRRSRVWSDVIDFPSVFACQDGISPERAVDVALELDCVGLFVGGTVSWKRENAESFVTEAHEVGLECHIARPTDLTWAENTGCDSVDTTTYARNQCMEKLRQLEEQSTFSELPV